jgi:hypothetical protein
MMSKIKIFKYRHFFITNKSYWLTVVFRKKVFPSPLFFKQTTLGIEFSFFIRHYPKSTDFLLNNYEYEALRKQARTRDKIKTKLM